MMRSMTRRRLALALPAGLALLVFAAVAHAKTYDIPRALGATLKRTDAKTPVAILVPSKLALDYDGHAYASGFGGSRSYTLTLGGRRAAAPTRASSRRSAPNAAESRTSIRRSACATGTRAGSRR